MKKYLLLVLLSPFALQAQDKSLFEKKTFISNADTMCYRILLPLNYNAKKKYPVIFFLHGAGERGSDNEAQLTHGVSLFLADSNRAKYPAIVIFPQCAQNSFWSNVTFPVENGKRNFHFTADGAPTSAMVLLQGLIAQTLKTYPVQKKQVYVGGLSMGGMGTLELLRRDQKDFAAAFAICGGADTTTAKAISKVPLWLFHGAKDDVVPPHYSTDMADALLRLKATVKLTIYPNDNHNSWDSALKEPDFLSWLFSNKRKGK